MSSRSNYPVQGQRGDRYTSDQGQSGQGAGFEEDPLVELARIVSEGNARYRPVALGTEGDAPQGSYDASRDLVDHEAWARELEAGLSSDFGTYAPETPVLEPPAFETPAFDTHALESHARGGAADHADDSYPQDQRDLDALEPQPLVDEVYADRALEDEGLAYGHRPADHGDAAYADDAYAEDAYAEEAYAEEAYAEEAVEAADPYAPLQAGGYDAQDSYDDEDVLADEAAYDAAYYAEPAVPARTSGSLTDDLTASLEDELLGALSAPRAAEPGWDGEVVEDEAQQDAYDLGEDDLLAEEFIAEDEDLAADSRYDDAGGYGAPARYRDAFDEAVDDIFAAEAEAPPPPGGYDLDEVAQAMREGNPHLGGHGVLPPHSQLEMEAAEPAPKSKRGLYVAAAVLGVVVLGGGVFALTNIGGGESSGPPPVITAEGEDLKVYPDNQAPAANGQSKLIYDRVGSDGEERLVLQEEEAPVATLPPAPLPEANESERAAGTPAGPRRVRTVVVRPDGTIISTDEPAGAPAQQAPAATADADGVRQVATTPITGGGVGDLDAADASQLAPPSDPAGQPATETLAGPAEAQPLGTPAAAGTDPAGPNVPRTKPGDIDTLAANAAPARQAEPARSPQAPLDLTAQAPRVPTTPAPAQPQPAATQAPATQAPATQASAPAASGGTIPAGTYIVQVSSQRTREQAQTAFNDLQRRYGSVLGGVSPVIEQADLGDRGTFYRVRIPTSSRDDAISLCERLKSAGGDCFVRRN